MASNCQCVGCDAARRRNAYLEARGSLIAYLRVKVKEGDWHAVSDAANDLRVMEAKYEATK